MRFDKSRELFERSKLSLAGGVSSMARMPETPVPLFFERGKGSKLYDVDGNEFIDYVLAFGPEIFGYSPDFLLEAVGRALQKGQHFAGQHELEITVSEMVQTIVPCAGLVRYASSGTEIDQAAIRLARGHTGKTKIIKFEGHYHGWGDSVHYSVQPPLDKAGPVSAPVPVPVSAGISRATAQEIIVLSWNDIDILRQALDRHGDDVAAIITEPINCNTSHITPKPGYLEGMKTLCDEHRVVLIFDEVITGFRVALGGAQEYFGVTPDLATYAKAVGGGFTLAMMAGKEEIMSQLVDGTVVHSGTLNSNPISMAAAEASLRKLSENDGAVYRHLYATGRQLMDGLRGIAAKHEQPLLIQGPGPTFSVIFTEAEEITDYRSHVRNVDREKYARFRLGMLERGVRLVHNGWWLVSTAHSQEDVVKTLAAADEAMASL